jgi:choloylglycine hydrolase
MQKIRILSWLSFIFFIFIESADACTDFLLKAKDGTVLVTRSMEFGIDFKSNLRSSPRGRQFATTSPDGQPTMSWKGKYGYLGLDGLDADVTFDGMNEKGLSFEYLYLPGETQYQTIPTGKNSKAIPYFNFGDWILSSFSSIDEVKKALMNIYVFQEKISQFGDMILPAHAAIFDSTGKGIVVEFIHGKIQVHDNIGIMTNSPTYEWHVTNLRNYLNLSPYNPSSYHVNDLTFSATGQGAGMVGLPGDVSPPSRFVKIAFMLKNVYPAASAADELNLAEHIINNVDIPAGLARSVNQGQTTTDLTEWVVFKDLTHKIFYYRTYNDMTIRSVTMDKIDFSENAARLKMS